MGGLGTLLEVLYSAHSTSLHVELRDLVYPAPDEGLVVKLDETGRTDQLRWSGAGPWPEPTLTSRELWFSPPGRLRVELRHGDVLVRFGVRDGMQWWRWDHQHGTTSGRVTEEAAHARFPPFLAPPLLAPAQLIPMLGLEPLGLGRRAGRDVLIARAWLRQQPKDKEQMRYELEFDAEYGTMLRHEAFRGLSRIQLTEALAITYGCMIEPARFSFRDPEEASEHSAPHPRA